MKLTLPTILYSMVLAVVMSLVFVTMGQLYAIRQNESAATTDAALSAAAEILQGGGSYTVDATPAIQAGTDAYQHTWALQHPNGLTTVGDVTIRVYSDHVTATGTSTFIPAPLWPLTKMFPNANLPAVSITRTGTASLQN